MNEKDYIVTYLVLLLAFLLGVAFIFYVPFTQWCIAG